MATTIDSFEIHRLSRTEYKQMVESGALEDLRVELIDGFLCDMTPLTPEHCGVAEYLTRVLARALDHERYRLRVASPLMIEGSAPEPDFAVVARDTPEDYHPITAELVIEVSVSSFRRDVITKPRIYAAAGITQYWVIDVERLSVLVHREPLPDRYRVRDELSEGELLDASVVGLDPIPVADIFAAAQPPR